MNYGGYFTGDIDDVMFFNAALTPLQVKLISTGKALFNSILKAYPNPAKDILNVTIPFGTNKEMTLLVTDASGRIILSKITHDIKGESNFLLDVSHLTPGIYFIKLVCENAALKFGKNKDHNLNFPAVHK